MKQYVVDAFTDSVFKGNPAAVCVMDAWLDDELMMSITRENNLSETAFTVRTGEGRYHLRWFTPGGEIDLCGHATLGTAYTIMNFYEPDLQQVRFDTMSGELIVDRKGDLYELNFPAYELQPVDVTPEMIDAIGMEPTEAYMARDLLCVFENEEDIWKIQPDLEKLKNIDGLLLHITAAAENDGEDGEEYDCVSRSFAPKLNVPEDPVCGSGHCHIVPYWADQFGKDDIVAFQASRRTGVLYCEMDGERIRMAGKAALYSTAELNV